MQDFHAKLVPSESPIKVERSSYPLSPLSPNRNIVAIDVPSEKPLLSLEIKLETDSSVGKVFGAASQPETEPSPAFEFKSGTAVIVPHKTADLEPMQTSTTPISIQSPASSSIVPTSSNDAAAQDESFHTLGLPSDDSPDDREVCQTLLQSPSMDVIPSHDVQSSLQDRSPIGLDMSVAASSPPLESLFATTTEVFNGNSSVSPPIPEVSTRRSPIGLDMSVATSSPPLESLFATTTEVFNGNSSVSPPIPEVSTRRSSRLSSNRSSRSTTSEGFGTAYDFESRPSSSVPASRSSTPEVQESSSLPSPAKTYGGFRALTWKDFRKDLSNFTPKTFYAKDLPHALQDHINSMSEYTQMMLGMRDLFKATILENTVEDEPDAPPIEIWNNVDTQSTPPWEFYYTNNMWLGEGVPPPDFKSLLSCTCKGGCNPKSKTCACLLRQRDAYGDPQLEFAYDKNGKLRIPGYPIFECNDLCGCSDECRNRVSPLLLLSFLFFLQLLTFAIHLLGCPARSQSPHQYRKDRNERLGCVI
jgi:Pre-SET motif